MQKKITAIVKFYLLIARNCDQSCANTQFSPRVVQFKFSPPGGLWCHLQIISSCRKLQYGHLDTLNTKICPLFQEIQAEQVGCKICDGTQQQQDSLQYCIGSYASFVVLCVKCYLCCVMCYMLLVICYISCLTCNVLCIMVKILSSIN